MGAVAVSYLEEAAADDGKFMGAGPHSTQYSAALGQSPESSTDAVEVHAGLKLLGRDGRALIVCSSDNTPFKIDLAVDVQDIERIMRSHTCMSEISSGLADGELSKTNNKRVKE